jgi:A/G-specific adenine glycosylase
MTKQPQTSRLKAEISTQLIPWFSANSRRMPWRNDRTPYRVWISELMLQQTRVDQVIPYFERFMERFPTLESLAAASQDEVLKAWEGLGYYSRARNMHAAAKQIMQEQDGLFPNTANEILALPGIGPYTTAAIGSLAFNLDLAVLDGNVIRVLTRLYAYPKDTCTTAAKKELQQIADDLLVHGDAGRCNEAFMELGATLCTPRSPQCTACPLATICLAHMEGAPENYPVKAPKKKVPHIVVGAAVTRKPSGEILIAQRRDQDMLGGLWEFPGGKQEIGETIQQCIIRELQEELGITVKIDAFLITVKHAYSHFTMDMHTFYSQIISGAPKALHCKDFKWADLNELRQHPFSKADLKVIEALEAADEL